MASVRRLARVLVMAAALAATACGNPPDKEMQQAQGAIEAARAAGADQYAHQEFTAAEDALKHAREAVDQRDYRLALNHALDSRERAQSAAKEAADRKAVARGDADRALTDAVGALNEARAKLKAAETRRAPAGTLAKVRRVINNGDETVQKARAAFGRGEYLAVLDTLGGVTPRLLAASRDLDAAVAPAPRRRR